MFWTIEMFLNFLIAQMKIKQIEIDKLKKFHKNLKYVK